MASTVTAAPATTGLTALPATAGTITLAGTIRSEFTKLRSVRSTYWTLLALIVVTVGIGALGSWGAASHWSQMGPGDRASFDPTQQSLFGLILGQLIIAVLGALTITSEFGTGMVRTSLSAQPRRGLMIAAKGFVFTVVALVTGLVASFGAFFLGQALMSGKHINTTLSQPHVLSAVVGGALFLTVCGMLAFGLGLLVRHTAGAITAAVGLLFVLFIMVNFLPQSWQDSIDRWLPFNAGSGVWRSQAELAGNHLFAPWTGFAVFVGYAVIAIAAGVILFRRRNV
jgi:ABC-type transport system involved in multi-copper enzyme maturation permease subunit